MCGHARGSVVCELYCRVTGGAVQVLLEGGRGEGRSLDLPASRFDDQARPRPTTGWTEPTETMSLRLVLLVGSAKAAEVSLTWKVSMNPQTKTVSQGDTVVFTWGGTHNVYESASKSDFDSCAKSGGTEVGAQASGGSYSKVFDTPGTFYYICTVGSHCNSGQKMAITVTEGVATSPPPSPAPSPPPCFPSSSMVTLATGVSVRIDSLREGSRILAATADGTLTTDEVSALSIARPHARASFVVVTTASGARLSLTPEHHVAVGDACCTTLKKAKDLLANQDRLWRVEPAARGERMRAEIVSSIAHSTDVGLHSPVMRAGGFPIVDGFATAFDSIGIVHLASFFLPYAEPLIAPLATRLGLKDKTNLVRGAHAPTIEGASIEINGTAVSAATPPFPMVLASYHVAPMKDL